MAIKHSRDSTLVLWDCPSGNQVWARTKIEAAEWSQYHGGGNNVTVAKSATGVWEAE
jgi:hypothetical protein